MTIDWDFYPAKDFGAHQDQWQEINLSGPASPLLSSRFVAPFIRHYSDGDEILAVCRDGRDPVAMTILKKVGTGKWETFQPSQAPVGMLVSRKSVEVADLLESLLASLPGLPLMVGIYRLDPDLIARPAESGHVATLDFIHTARVLVNRTFDEYWKARDGKLRQETNRRLKRLQESGIVPRLERVVDPAAVAAGIDDFGKLESAGWKGREGTAIRGDNEQGAFYKSLLASFCEIGKGRIYRYWFGDAVAAMQLCVEGERVMVFLKTTYDEGQKNYGPGILMQHAIMKELFAEGAVDKVEFYGRSGQPQTKWCDNQIRTMYHVNYYRWPFLPKIKRMAARVGAAGGSPESTGTSQES